MGVVTPKLERVIYVLEWARIEEFADDSWDGIGRPPHVRAWLANAFVAKAVLGITTTVGLVERLTMDKTLRRICGFPPFAKLPSEATFSRAFAQFAEERLVERAYAAMIKEHLGDQLIGHISRDGTAIAARERPAAAASAASRKQGRRKGKRPVKQAAPASGSPIRRQRGQTLPDMLAELPTICDRGTKCNAQGYKTSWNGYKLHIDTADCGVPIAAL
ncbi:IS5/IS1182 family transposase, partial [Massilia sp. CCM 8734]|nr:IS5/IS1182 family transposase [Massilia sp. CCM 8734]